MEILLAEIFEINVTNDMINDVSFKLGLPTLHDINIFLIFLKKNKHTKDYLIRKNILLYKLKNSKYKYIFKPNKNRIFWRFFREGSKRKILDNNFLKKTNQHTSNKAQFEPYIDIVDIVDKSTGYSIFIFFKKK